MNAEGHYNGACGVTEPEARAELERLLSDPRFHGTERARSILTYLAQRHFKGQPDGVKAYSIALDVLGRTSDFDPSGDPIVRIEVSRLRSSLSQYYQAYPPYDAAKASDHDFIGYINFLLQFTQPTVAAEKRLMARFAEIGIRAGMPWDASKVDPALLKAIDQGIDDAKADMKATAAKTLSSNGLFGSRKFMNGNYMTRAMGAEKGLYGNSIEEAWYGGFLGDGAKGTKLHFAPGQLPPAKFFWSLTLYTLPDRFLYANQLKRYSIGDRTQGLVYGKDKSLTIYLGHTSPGADKEANWLPTPEGKYSLVGRIYGPSRQAIEGKWNLPHPEPMN